MQIRAWQLLHLLLIAPAAAEVTTTQDLLDDSAWGTSGSVLDHTQYGHSHFDYQGGVIYQNIDISTYQGQTALTYDGYASACENHIGGHCQSGTEDPVTVTFYLHDASGALVDTYSETFNIGYQTEYYTVEYNPTSDLAQVHLSISAYDQGFWAGWYGPVVYNGQFTVTYDPDLVTVILPATEDPTLQTTTLSDAFMPDTTAMSMDLDPGIATSIPEVEVSMPATEVASDIAPQTPGAADVKTEISTPESTSSPSVATVERSDAGPSSGSTSNKSESKNENAATISTSMGVIDVATASVSSIGNMVGDPSDPVAQTLMVLAMATQGADLQEARLDEPELPKAPRMRKKRFEDRFWLDSLRSEVRFQKYMVDAQWQR